MKLVIAIIQPNRLDSVREQLIEDGITRITVTRVSGHGQAPDLDLYRGLEIAPNLSPKIRLEIAVNDAFLETTIDAILRSARTGEIGDGKIFVVPLEECIRVRTGERGGGAI
jgi:nitrogen regulatory protein P-II 1